MDMFYALAEPTRRNIIEMLASDGQLSATDICDKFRISHPAISQHLKILREANLVNVEKRAQQRIYRLNPNRMIELEKWAKHMTLEWEGRLDALDAVLQEEKAKLSGHTKKGNMHGRKTR